MKEQDKVWLYKTHNSKNVLNKDFDEIKNFILGEFNTIHKNLSVLLIVACEATNPT